MENANALPAGYVVAGYRVDGILGFGGFGITYIARDMRLDVPVALKEYFPGTLALRSNDHTVTSRPEGHDGGYSWGLEKFLQEATTLAKLHHPNIVGVNRLFHGNGTAYMALDFIEGPNLKAWLKSLRQAPTQQQLDALLLPLLLALEAVHNKGLLHRDIAPKNVMISRNSTPILIDFGAARQLVAQRSQTFAALLTPGYAPFEQYVAAGSGQGPWTDIYALAATFYEAILGRPPPEAPERALEDRCVPAEQIGAGRYRINFLRALDWGLRPLPKNRPQTVAEWRKMLFAQGSQLTAPPITHSNEDQVPSPSAKKVTQWFVRS